VSSVKWVGSFTRVSTAFPCRNFHSRRWATSTETPISAFRSGLIRPEEMIARQRSLLGLSAILLCSDTVLIVFHHCLLHDHRGKLDSTVQSSIHMLLPSYLSHPLPSGPRAEASKATYVTNAL
jgi:hypothetical protein